MHRTTRNASEKLDVGSFKLLKDSIANANGMYAIQHGAANTCKIQRYSPTEFKLPTVQEAQKARALHLGNLQSMPTRLQLKCTERDNGAQVLKRSCGRYDERLARNAKLDAALAIRMNCVFADPAFGKTAL